jgi:hypothetical protein
MGTTSPDPRIRRGILPGVIFSANTGVFGRVLAAFLVAAT